MRSFIAALITLIVVIVGSIFYTIYVDHIANDLIKQIDKISYSIDKKGWKETEKEYKSFKKHYLIHEKTLYLLITHEQISTMNTLIDALSSYVASHDKKNSLAFSAMLKFQFINIPQEEYLSLSNIL